MTEIRVEVSTDQIQRIAPKILQAWTAQAATALDILATGSKNRMAARFTSGYSTGAMASSVAAKTGGNANQLGSVFTTPGPQIGSWNRVYASYQEGPPEGETTWTAGNRHVFFDAQTEDVGALELWATSVAKQVTP